MIVEEFKNKISETFYQGLVVYYDAENNVIVNKVKFSCKEEELEFGYVTILIKFKNRISGEDYAISFYDKVSIIENCNSEIMIKDIMRKIVNSVTDEFVN